MGCDVDNVANEVCSYEQKIFQSKTRNANLKLGYDEISQKDVHEMYVCACETFLLLPLTRLKRRCAAASCRQSYK